MGGAAGVEAREVNGNKVGEMDAPSSDISNKGTYIFKVFVPNCTCQHFRVQWSISLNFLELIGLVMFANLDL